MCKHCNHRFWIQWKMTKHMRKHKVKLIMSQEKPLAQVSLPLILPLAQKLLQKKFSLYPYGNPLRTNIWMNVFPASDVKITASIQPVCSQNHPQNQSDPKVMCSDGKEEFPTKNYMIDDKRDSDTDHPSKKKYNQPDCQESKCFNDSKDSNAN